MTTEIIAFIVISLLFIGFVAFHIWYVKQMNEQMRFYIKASKANDFYQIQQADKKQEETAVKEAEYIPVETADDNLFSKMINQKLEVEEE